MYKNGHCNSYLMLRLVRYTFFRLGCEIGFECIDLLRFCLFLLARLPFKRLNPELKGNNGTKRPRGPPASSCLENGVSDGENDEKDTSPPGCPLPTIFNGRGPLDGFVVKQRKPGFPPSAPVATIDLTEDSNSSETVQQQPEAVSKSCSAFKDDCVLAGSLEVSRAINSHTCEAVMENQNDGQVNENDHMKNTDTEGDIHGDFDTEVRHESGLLSSAVSTSSLSTVESSPESHKTAQRPQSSIAADQVGQIASN